jgi:beta-aspartyl-peptidase (threonine type)
MPHSTPEEPEMKTVFTLLVIQGLVMLSCQKAPLAVEPVYGLMIHGGAGDGITLVGLGADQVVAYEQALRRVVESAFSQLEKGASAVDVVQSAIVQLEDDSLFNAGRGAVLTDLGQAELDASIMDGRNLAAGAVAGVKTVKNPILLAHKVMTVSPHVFLAGEGAEAFARLQELQLVSPDYFITAKRQREWLKAKSEKKAQGSLPKAAAPKFGTVGAVVLDRQGNLAAGTSTGGMMFKQFGRIGDAPVIGAGTYADNQTCAVSATGHGEYFIRLSVAQRIRSLMAYRNLNVKQAADEVIHTDLQKLGGKGGVIVIDREGNLAAPFNTRGMFHAWQTSRQKAIVNMFEEMQN